MQTLKLTAEAKRLAQSIADATGETVTQTVLESLRDRYANIEHRKGKAPVNEILAIADRVSARINEPYIAHAELLYDQNGLPK